MAKPKLTYEEIRQKRLDENKKKMEALNLRKLSSALSSASPKPSPAKKARVHRQPAELATVRRSSRFADKPPVSYKDEPLGPLERPRRSYGYRRRDLLNRVYASDEVRQYAIGRAENLQSDMDSDFPSFVKPMLQSHVTGGFWLGLPVQFCKTHLPHRDEFINLEDENGYVFATKYLAEKTGLSGGWRGFAIDHELVDGDALVFQLISSTKFKVYIIRAYESEDNKDKENNGDGEKDLGASHLDRSAKRIRASRK